MGDLVSVYEMGARGMTRQSHHAVRSPCACVSSVLDDVREANEYASTVSK